MGIINDWHSAHLDSEKFGRVEQQLSLIHILLLGQTNGGLFAGDYVFGLSWFGSVLVPQPESFYDPNETASCFPYHV